MKQKGQTQLGNVSEFYKMGTCIDAVFNLTQVLHVCVCVCGGGGGGAAPLWTRFVLNCIWI